MGEIGDKITCDYKFKFLEILKTARHPVRI